MAFKDLPNDSMQKTIIVAVALCLVCSIFVSASAVFLKPLQEKNKLLDKQKNIIQVADIPLAGRSVPEAFDQIEARVLDLRTGEFAEDIDPRKFDQRKAASDPDRTTDLSPDEDIAGIKRREHHAVIYITRDEAGDIEKLILPVRGYGLWSTLWGFLALEGDGNTIIGLSFYEHAETPGLGGEVDNPNWKAQWEGKKVYGDEGEVKIRLAKGDTKGAPYKVDTLAGATLTARGVTNLLHYWMGEQGYAPFLDKLAEGQV